jgi:hypothetical protein
MVMKLKAEARAQGGCRASEKKKGEVAHVFKNHVMKGGVMLPLEIGTSRSERIIFALRLQYRNTVGGNS